MSARDLRQSAVILLVVWAVVWGAVYGISASRDAKAREAIDAMSASRAATARAAADETRSCNGGGPCRGQSNDAVVRQFLVDRGMSPQLQADQQAYLRNFGQVEARAHAWLVRAVWWGAGGLIFMSLSAAAGIWLWRGFQPRT